MSRIRSVHPGLWTDERFVSVTPLARLLFIGIWNECDDYGSFEWSPLKLKMRLLPADNVNAGELLAELTSAGVIRPYSLDGKQLGAVRNFGKYQRPKKPSSYYPQTPDIRAFCTEGSELTPHIAGSVPNEFPTSGENPPQMEDGGGRMEEGSSDADASGAVAPPSCPQVIDPPKPIDLKAAVFASGVPLLTSTGMSDRNARSLLGRWRQQYRDGAVLDALSAAQAESPSDPVAWITRVLETRNGPVSAAGDRRGSRPSPALELFRRGAAREAEEARSSEDGATDRGAWPSLPAVRRG